MTASKCSGVLPEPGADPDDMRATIPLCHGGGNDIPTADPRGPYRAGEPSGIWYPAERSALGHSTLELLLLVQRLGEQGDQRLELHVDRGRDVLLRPVQRSSRQARLAVDQ